MLYKKLPHNGCRACCKRVRHGGSTFVDIPVIIYAPAGVCAGVLRTYRNNIGARCNDIRFDPAVVAGATAGECRHSVRIITYVVTLNRFSGIAVRPPGTPVTDVLVYVTLGCANCDTVLGCAGRTHGIHIHHAIPIAVNTTVASGESNHHVLVIPHKLVHLFGRSVILACH